MNEKYSLWLEKLPDGDPLRTELESIKDNADEINDRFYKELKFGTGGLRGKIGVGTNRMNVYTVGRATMGFADYLIANGKKSACIAYDSRKMSREFAFLAADVLSSFGVTAYVFDRLTPTPVLSFAVRSLGVGGGLVITASHNPKEYNGYKAYNDKGCQLTDEAANEVTDLIEKHDYFEKFDKNPSLVHVLDGKILDEFIDTIYGYSLPFDKKFAPKIIYTPLNGTGLVPVRKILAKMGITDYTVVPEQENPDGNFTTCPFPNPEEKAALKKALELAEKEKAELVIATDPDADRMGIAVRDKDGSYRLFNGNETGALMEYYLLSVRKAKGEIPKNSYVIETVVSSPLIEKIAAAFGVKTYSVLTGFKYIGETIDRAKNENFLFGMEESYGYLVGVHARDKDSISAVMTIVEAVCYYKEKGLDLIEALNDIYEKFGYYSTGLYSKYFEGEQGMIFMSDFMKNLRGNSPKEILGRKVESVKDYSLGIDGLPKSDVLKYKGDGFELVVRPSGTEPKLKFYALTNAETEEKSAKLKDDLLAYVSTTL